MDIDPPEPEVITVAPPDSQDQHARFQDQNTTNETLWRMEGVLHSVSRGVQVLVDLAKPPQQDDMAFGGDQPAEVPPPLPPKPPVHGSHLGQQGELERAKEENATLSASLEAAREELRDARIELSNARQNEGKLRSIILEKAGSQKVSDVEVRDKFVSLRQKAQAIANSQAYDVENGPRRARGSMTPEMAAFYEVKAWSRLTPKDRKNLVMSHMFHMIHSYILDRAIFSALVAEYIMPDDADQANVEPTLRRFEKLLELNGVNEDLVADWRILTMECVGKIKTDGPKGRRVAQKIFDFFAPILADLSQPGRDDLLVRISEMCHDAYDLRMMMRRSKTKYACEFPPTADSPCFQDKYEALVEPISVEGGKNKEGSDQIAYPLFGGLVKHAETGKKVLEKSQVIMKRR